MIVAHLCEVPLYTHPTFLEGGITNSNNGGEANGADVWRSSWQFLPRLSILLSRDPAIMLLGISPKDRKLVFTQKPAHRCWQQLYS